MLNHNNVFQTAPHKRSRCVIQSSWRVTFPTCPGSTSVIFLCSTIWVNPGFHQVTMINFASKRQRLVWRITEWSWSITVKCLSHTRSQIALLDLVLSLRLREETLTPPTTPCFTQREFFRAFTWHFSLSRCCAGSNCEANTEVHCNSG